MTFAVLELADRTVTGPLHKPSPERTWESGKGRTQSLTLSKALDTCTETTMRWPTECGKTGAVYVQTSLLTRNVPHCPECATPKSTANRSDPSDATSTSSSPAPKRATTQSSGTTTR